MPFEITIEKMEPERLFSFRWHPNAVERDADYSAEPTTLIEFLLEPAADGVLLTIDRIGLRFHSAGTPGQGFFGQRAGLEHGGQDVRGIHCRARPSSASLFAALGDPTRLRLVRRRL